MAFQPPQLALLIVLVTVLIVSHIYLFYYDLPKDGQDCHNCRRDSAVNLGKGRFLVDSPDRAKAAIVILARNTDIHDLQKTIPMFEERFNKKFGYPYVFLNDKPFSDKFKEAMRKLGDADMHFGQVPVEHWSYPSWIDQNKAERVREEMKARRVMYGDSLSYRHMCRYNSGFFFRHPLLDSYEYYWRVEPGVEFYCDIDYDPFIYMKNHKKEYGFVIMVPEYIETIPTLWSTMKKFIEKNPQYVHEKNVLKMFTNTEGNYNLCHFWSNFEIGSLNFYRSEGYLKFFEYLDKSGGFFYERWGDAPVHSLAAAMLLPKEKIHYFEDIGYYHPPYYNCPLNPALLLRCTCDPKKSEVINNNCFYRYLELFREQ